MADMTFNTTPGQTVKRELLALCLNTGTASTPVWSLLGKRVTDSSMGYDFGGETSTDILGRSYTELALPTVTQTFDPYALDGEDTALVKIWNMAVKDQDYVGLSSMDCLVIHRYAGTAETAFYAERYASCAIRPTGLGGAGGGSVSMPIEVTFGGDRTQGTAALAAGVITFTPDST